MPDLVTKIEDVIIPELFTEYVEAETKEKSLIVASGAVENNPLLDRLITGGGLTLTMPKWNDLTGESNVYTDKKDSETDKVGSHSEIATLIRREHSWAFHDLAAATAGSDPQKNIASKVARWWLRDEKRNLMAVLQGVFASSDMVDHILDISGESESNATAKAILDAKQLMGDAAEDLSLIYMHSAVYTELQKQQLITFKEHSDAKINMPTYLGYTVVTDDSAPVTLGTGGAKDVFTTYLLARGCIQRGMGTPVGFKSTAVERNEKSSTSMLFSRQAKVLHPKGMSWNAKPTDLTYETPSDTELANGAFWARVAPEHKMVGMVALKHTL